MSHLANDSFANAEERLRLAMLASDSVALDELIAPELLFTNHLGQVLPSHPGLSIGLLLRPTPPLTLTPHSSSTT
ncbi:hypothetical protein WG899_05050 [Paucibacter sp. AS339]|uniref:nuclear transport factor 2 family protein n=1 Tax=Paucibacter hankyongi TaxID=3133434 RepID=UPI0030AF312D